MSTPEPPAPTGPLMIAPFRELIHNIHQFGQSSEHWSWRCGVGYSTVDPGWVDGACRYDHVCGSWDELAQQGTAHLEKWHGIKVAPAGEGDVAGAVHDAALRRIADLEREMVASRAGAVPDTGQVGEAGTPVFGTGPGDPFRLQKWAALADDVCMFAGCNASETDQRGPVWLRGDGMAKACTEHWEPIMRVLGEQATWERTDGARLSGIDTTTPVVKR